MALDRNQNAYALVDILFMYFLSFSLFNFTTDTDKCEAFVGKCHKEATCNNTNGLYVCTCKAFRFLLNSAMRFFFWLFDDVYLANLASHVLIVQNR